MGVNPAFVLHIASLVILTVFVFEVGNICIVLLVHPFFCGTVNSLADHLETDSLQVEILHSQV